MNTPVNIDPKSNADVVITYAVNKSAATVADGDVVIIDTTDTLGTNSYVAVTTTTTANDAKVFGVVYNPGDTSKTFADGDVVPIMKFGIHTNVYVSTSLAADTRIATHTTAKMASTSTPAVGAVLGRTLTAESGNRATALIDIQ